MKIPYAPRLVPVHEVNVYINAFKSNGMVSFGNSLHYASECFVYYMK